jgi:purine-nucleoside phosphorylase
MSELRSLPSPRDGIPEAIADAIRERTVLQPVAGIVLGSGLSSAVEAVKAAAREGAVEFAYGELPGFPPPSVAGHAGKLWIGQVRDRVLAVFQGRVHFYEGHGMALASLSSRVSAQLGARTMVLTAAVGGLDPTTPPGSLVVLRDHINLMGVNPLIGWRMPDGSPAFVDVPDVYEPDLAAAALGSARAHAGDELVREGVYVALSGPSFETPAETRMLHGLGGTVVGMSMVPEAVAARALGMRALGLAFVTNAAGVTVSHEEVLQASKAASETVGRVLLDLVEML